jgi:hypothetical protein
MSSNQERSAADPDGKAVVRAGALTTIHSERMLMEQLDYNPLFRWFVDSSRCIP